MLYSSEANPALDALEAEAHTLLTPTIFPPYADTDSDAAMRPMNAELFKERWNHNRTVYAAHSKNTYRRTTREAALQRQFVQVNAPNRRNLITVDVDRSDAADFMEDLTYAGKLPLFSFLVVNPSNGHAHAGWFIEGEARTQKQQEAFRVLVEAFTVLSGEQAGVYTGHGMRNPVWAGASVRWGSSRRYNFNELFDYVPAATRAVVEERHEVERSMYGKDMKMNPSSSSRHQDLFHAVRLFLYGKQGRKDFVAFAQSYAHQKNEEFDQPLKAAEVNSLARNVARFCMTRMKATAYSSPEEFSRKQSERASSAPVVKAAHQRHALVLDMVEAGADTSSIANYYGVTKTTARQYVSRARAWAARTHGGEGQTATGEQGAPQPETATVEGLAVNTSTGAVLVAQDTAEHTPTAEAQEASSTAEEYDFDEFLRLLRSTAPEPAHEAYSYAFAGLEDIAALEAMETVTDAAVQAATTSVYVPGKLGQSTIIYMDDYRAPVAGEHVHQLHPATG